MVAPDPAGVDTVCVILKGTFRLAAEPVLADEQIPITAGDQYAGEPANSGIVAVNDLVPLKPGTDVLLLGTAHAVGGMPVAQMEVGLQVGPIDKRLRVIGDRAWHRDGRNYTAAQPFEAMPLVWERAFGGFDEAGPEAGEPIAELRNPAGTGYRVGQEPERIEGLRLPNLEYPDQLIATPGDRPAPAGFGPIAPHWQPRAGFAGTFDEAWRTKRAPFLPADFDPRFYQAAPPDQIVPGYLVGGETVTIWGATPVGSAQFRLPLHQVQVAFSFAAERHAVMANIDTVIIEPDIERLIMIWRAVFPAGRRVERLDEVQAWVVGGLEAPG